MLPYNSITIVNTYYCIINRHSNAKYYYNPLSQYKMSEYTYNHNNKHPCIPIESHEWSLVPIPPHVKSILKRS